VSQPAFSGTDGDPALQRLYERASAGGLILVFMALYAGAAARVLDRAAMTEAFALYAPIKVDLQVEHAISGEWTADTTPQTSQHPHSAMHCEAARGAEGRIRCSLTREHLPAPVSRLDWKPFANAAVVNWSCKGDSSDATPNAADWFSVCSFTPLHASGVASGQEH
jgi:hypothetical protein